MLIHIHEPHSRSRQVELGRWRVSEKLFRDYLNVEQAISLAAGFAESNRLVPCSNYEIAPSKMMSLRPQEFHG